MITEYFFIFPVFVCVKMEKINVPNRTLFFQSEKIFFPSATRQGTMKFQIEAIYWGCEKIGNKYFFKK